MAQQDLLQRVRTSSASRREPKPIGYQSPHFNTPMYWRDCARGWISEERQQRDHTDWESRRRRAIDSRHSRARAPQRHLRDAPRASKQFSKPMSTLAARDDRLTPQSKALLQLLVARAGRGRSTDTTKTTLGKVLNRCPRSIQRYLRELVNFGYVRTQTVKSRRTGFCVGLRVWIMDCVLPFWTKPGRDREPSERLHPPGSQTNRVETEMPPTNNKDILRSLLGDKKPPWGQAYAWR